MIVLFVFGVIMLWLGAKTGELAFLSLGAGAFILGWFGLLKEDWAQMARRVINVILGLPKLRRSMNTSLMNVDKILPFIKAFACAYPNYIRLPYLLDEWGRVSLVMSRGELFTNIYTADIPPQIGDLRAILEQKGGYVESELVVLLLVNREVRELLRTRICREVIQGTRMESAEELRSLWLRFAVWEQDRALETGGRSLLFRELLTELLVERLGIVAFRVMAGARFAQSATSMVDGGIESAKRGMLQRRRALKLEMRLSPGSDRLQVDNAAASADLQLLSTAYLAAQGVEQAASVTNALKSVFLGQKKSVERRLSAATDGYFVTESDGKRVLFQVGFVEQGVVSSSAVEKAFLHKAKEDAVQAVVLPLSFLEPQVIAEADTLGVLILPCDELDRLLAYHTDRIWQTVDWSLRASRDALARSTGQQEDEQENSVPGLELGLST